MMTQSTNTDHDLLAEVSTPDGVTAGPWRTDSQGHLERDLSDGRIQRGNGDIAEAAAGDACRIRVGTVTSWHEVATHLTPTQNTFLRDSESRGAEPEDLAEYARGLAEQNVRDAAVFGDLPVPPDATAVYTSNQMPDGRYSRDFVGARRRIGLLCLSVEGTQFDDGAVRRRLHIGFDSTDGSEPEFDSHQVHQLILVLGQLASAIEQTQ
ncbi:MULTISPECIES: hypothetical protein [Mycobacteriaceae]|uniref:Uncharacterized protein n=1 Tax=Mycolicibacterium neoaurum VKM Ac-1815D TaxID=700508 RepID=V5XJR6_MYCNE|nr:MULTISPECIES: hypothetical protein [Mycobacteriaceae]AHC28019.1 hypothetical protein D174_19405 [Mycolicibacterium neoaurum VKM Ac-1815D]AMO06923.1 hypothetical protein MyAD_19035 [Mycolicibacterium neoaurum]AXK74713.1 hypothetical protein DXK33_05905 [Mycolicibacterium neoaurum]KJQ48100.1 hypothetical protein TS71_23025 [Mycolicibacterium neoaurum]KUM06135.1 hypothetical protein AVZ31_22895 [Mycolicibacterium neoaurum]